MAQQRKSSDERDNPVERLREFIRFNYTTGSEVARQIGVRDTTVYSWLSGESRPKNPECIARFLDSMPDESGGGEPKPRGIIAVNVSKIWHLDLEGSTRFPSAIINGKEFPSYIVVARNDHELSREAGERAEAFVWLHRRLWHRTFESGVIGAIFYFNVPGLSLSERAGTFVCTYPILTVFPNFSVARLR